MSHRDLVRPAISSLTRRSRRSVLYGVVAGTVTLLNAPRLAIAQQASPDACPDQTPDTIMDMASRLFTAGLGHGNLDVVDEIFEPDASHNMPSSSALTHSSIKQMLANLRIAFPDLEVTLGQVFTDGEFVVIRWTQHGTFAAPFQGVEPSGQAVTWDGIAIFQFVCGQIVESWIEADTLTQLGLWPASPADPTASPAATMATPAVACEPLAPADGANIAAGWYQAFTNPTDTAFTNLASPTIVHHFGIGHDTVGIDALRAGARIFATAFPDLGGQLQHVIVTGNLVTLRYTMSGTFNGPFLNFEPNGMVANWSGITILRVECGLVVESWSEVSGFRLWQQLGLLTATPDA